MSGIRTPTDISTLKELLKNRGEAVIEDMTISDYLILRATDEINCSGIVFRNCTFSKILFSNIELRLGVKFIDCDIEHSLVFSDVKIAGYSQDFNYYNSSLEFHQVKIKGTCDIKNVNFERGIVFKSNCEAKHFLITNCKFEIGSVTFEKSIFNEMFNVEGCITKEFRIEECNFLSQIRLSNILCSTLVFMQSTFKKDVYVRGCKVEHHLAFNDGLFENSVVIQSVKSSGTLSLIGSEFKTELNVLYTDNTPEIEGGFKNVYISSCSVGSRMSFIGSENADSFYSIGEVTIKASEKLKGEINFRNFEIEKTILTGNNINGKIRFNHIHFQNLKIDEFTNASKVQFYDVISKGANSSLETFNSNLGLSEFYNVDFSSFKKITIKTSILSEIITANVIWFNREQLYPNMSLSRDLLEIEWRNNREVFRQLKYAMEKQGNKIQSLDFKSYEMECFKYELLQQYHTKTNFWNKGILFLNQSNDFGINYIKPFILIIITSLFFYCLIVVGISNKLSFVLGGGCEDIMATFSEFKNYSYGLPKMLSPLYDFSKAFNIDKEAEKNLSFWVSLADILYRITLSYLIFQLISAFRKFVK